MTTAGEIDGIDVDLRDRLIEAGRAWRCSLQQLVDLAAQLAAADLWRRDGAPTPAHWIAELLDVEVCTAREWIRVGEKLSELPGLDRAFRSGRLSFSKVRAISRVATPEHEDELIAIGESVPAGQIAVAVAKWRMRHEAPAETEARQRRERSVTLSTDPDGMVWGRFRLPPLAGSALKAALDADLDPRSHHTTTEPSAVGRSTPSLAQQRADALARLVDAEGEAKSIGAEVVIHVRGDGASMDDGTPIPASVIERIAPAAFLRVMVHDAQRRPIDVSGRHRHPTHRQRLLVLEKYGGRCVECGSRDFLEIHHEPPYSVTGQTLVDQLEPKCGRCHRRGHREVDDEDPSAGEAHFSGE